MNQKHLGPKALYSLARTLHFKFYGSTIVVVVVVVVILDRIILFYTLLLRGTLVNRTYGIHKNLYV